MTSPAVAEEAFVRLPRRLLMVSLAFLSSNSSTEKNSAHKVYCFVYKQAHLLSRYLTLRKKRAATVSFYLNVLMLESLLLLLLFIVSDHNVTPNHSTT